MWKRLPFDRWLVWRHDQLGVDGLEEHAGDGRQVIVGGPADADRAVAAFLDGVDVVVAVERTYPDDLFARARTAGKRCVLLVNPEWFVASRPFVVHADLLVARTVDCADLLARERIPRVLRIPCPLDLDGLPFVERAVADRFMFTNGWGGVHDRKGWPAVRDALRRDGRLPLAVRSQKALPDAPPGIAVGGAVERPADLYTDVDVAVQPSRFEGVGLAVLEAMACGVPVLTTNAAPMSEPVEGAFGHEAGRWLLPVAEVRMVQVWRPYPAHIVRGDVLAQSIRSLQGADIAAASRRARSYIERVHGDGAWALLWRAITGGARL